MTGVHPSSDRGAAAADGGTFGPGEGVRARALSDHVDRDRNPGCVWAILTVVGFVFEGLLWLGIIGIILIVGTLIFGVIRQRRTDRK